MLKFCQKLDTCAFYGEILVSLLVNTFTLHNLTVVLSFCTVLGGNPTWGWCIFCFLLTGFLELFYLHVC